jgi:phosphoenolpyruvate---glycerone phosphotransferase subunit DhaK
MRKLLNTPDSFVDDMLGGIYAAHPDMVTMTAGDLRCLVRAKTTPGKVGIATGGGSGHLPLFLGYVGEGLLDGCAVGGVFQSPSANQMLEVTKAIDAGAGVLYIYGNYTGDIMNFDMAAEMADMEDIRVLSLVGNDDVASAPKGEEHKRRGVAGIFFVYKCAGAMAAGLASLDEVKRVAEKANGNVRTMGVALSPCTLPQVGKPNFEIPEGEMALGMGIHGEPGIWNGALKKADDVTDELLAPIMADLELAKGDEVAVLVNGLGATPKEELYILYNRISKVLEEKGIAIHRPYVGEFATSMEMTGASISLLKLDDELKSLLDEPANTPFFVQK